LKFLATNSQLKNEFVAFYFKLFFHFKKSVGFNIQRINAA
jgi:hypothetical protein